MAFGHAGRAGIDDVNGDFARHFHRHFADDVGRAADFAAQGGYDDFAVAEVAQFGKLPSDGFFRRRRSGGRVVGRFHLPEVEGIGVQVQAV